MHEPHVVKCVVKYSWSAYSAIFVRLSGAAERDGMTRIEGKRVEGMKISKRSAKVEADSIRHDLL